jgi:site-specific recombinase XerD
MADDELMFDDDDLIDAFRRYWRLRRLALTTITNYTHSLSRASRWLVGGGSSLRLATRSEIEAFLAHRYEQVSIRTGHTDYKALRAFYRWLVDESDYEHTGNPIARIKGPSIKMEEAHRPTATEDDYKALRKVCKATGAMGRIERVQAVRDTAMIATLWWTGMRRAELAALDVDDVDLERGVIRLRLTKTHGPVSCPSPTKTCSTRP